GGIYAHRQQPQPGGVFPARQWHGLDLSERGGPGARAHHRRAGPRGWLHLGARPERGGAERSRRAQDARGGSGHIRPRATAREWGADAAPQWDRRSRPSLPVRPLLRVRLWFGGALLRDGDGVSQRQREHHDVWSEPRGSARRRRHDQRHALRHHSRSRQLPWCVRSRDTTSVARHRRVLRSGVHAGGAGDCTVLDLVRVRGGRTMRQVGFAMLLIVAGVVAALAQPRRLEDSPGRWKKWSFTAYSGTRTHFGAKPVDVK